MRFIRKDRDGFSAASMAGVIIGVVVTIVIAVSLVATVANQTWIAGQNRSFTNATSGIKGTGASALLPVLMVFFVIGIIVLPIALVFAALREST